MEYITENPFQLFELEDLPGEEVKWRLERFCLELLSEGTVEYRTPNHNQRLCVDGAIRLGVKTSAFSISSQRAPRVLRLLEIVHGLLIGNRTATVREISYRMKDDDGGVLSDSQCTRLIQLVGYLLGVSRASLKLIASSKGMVCGLNPANPAEMMTIPHFDTFEDLGWILDAINQMQPKPEVVLVLEKFTIFHRLTQSKFPHVIRPRSIIVTGRGYPDILTRRFVKFLNLHLGLPCLGVCDFNPHGISLMGSYAYGSISLAGDAFKYVVPDLIILGLTSQDARILLQHAANGDFDARHIVPLTHQDYKTMTGLKSIGVTMNNTFILEEIAEIELLGVKIDLDVTESIAPDYLYDEWLPLKIENALHVFNSQAMQE